MALGVKVSSWVDRVTSEKMQVYTMKISENMAEPEGIKEMVNQVAAQVTTALMMAFGDRDGGLCPTIMGSHREA